MQSVTSIYLHGFLSSGNSQKGQWFLQQVLQAQQSPEHIDLRGGDKSAKPPVFSRWLTPTYPIGSPQMTLAAIEEVIAEARQTTDQIILVGSSMGGFYAQYFGQKYQLPYVMINPALNPKPLFIKEKGARQNPVTGEQFEIDDDYIADLVTLQPKALNTSLPALLLIEEGDDVIDIPFALQQYQQVATAFKVKLYQGGSHAFDHVAEAWDEIQRFVADID